MDGAWIVLPSPISSLVVSKGMLSNLTSIFFRWVELKPPTSIWVFPKNGGTPKTPQNDHF